MSPSQLTSGSSIPDVFAYQVNRHGLKTAIVSESSTISYLDLHHKSNCVAEALITNGLEHGQTVSFIAEQGILQIVAILGILKAGGIYVPLDPYFDRRRLKAICNQSEASISLTDRLNHRVSSLIHEDHVRIINLEQVPDTIELSLHRRKLTLDDLAYIYYTSGTSGEPKGVVDTHRNVLHNILRYTSNLQIEASDRLTLLQSCGYSGAVSNIFSSLLNGATLLIYDVRKRGVTALAQWLFEQEPTIYHSVPYLFREVMRHNRTLPTLRIIRLEGDMARSIDADLFKRHFGSNCRLVNGLGSTETGISAQYFVDIDTPVESGVLPVGHTTLDMQIDIVDSERQPLERGSLGELRIASRFLAPGYWQRPELTNAAFEELDDGVRAYFSRDVGRINENGLLELHGRSDAQVKVRGEHVDVRSLEEALIECDGVSDVLVGASPNHVGSSQVTAWIVREAGSDVSAEHLRNTLVSSGWPLRAVPFRFEILDDWPVDPHGKLDLAALVTNANRRDDRTAPKTRMEIVVADVFRSTLEIETVWREDNFFELGGDSLKAVEACLELSRLTGNSHTLGLFQSAPTVQALARCLDGWVQTDCLVPLQVSGSAPPLFCVHAHMGHVFNLRDLAMQIAPDWSVYGLQARGLNGSERPDTSIEEMASTYVARIRRLQPAGPYFLAGYCFGGWVALEIARQLADRGESVGALFLIDSQLPRQNSDVRPELGRRSRIPGSFVGALDLSFDELIRKMKRRLARIHRIMRVRLLWSFEHLSRKNRWVRKAFSLKPHNANAVMQLDYRPLPYSGDAIVLIPSDRRIDSIEQENWKASITGDIEFENLAGTTTDLLRPPYTRDVAACMLERLCGQIDAYD